MMARRKTAAAEAVDEEQDAIVDVPLDEPEAPAPDIGPDLFAVEVRRGEADEWRQVALSTVALSADGRDVLRATWVFSDFAAAMTVAESFKTAGYETRPMPFVPTRKD